MIDETPILTPEGAVVTFSVATLPARVGAALLDLIVLLAVLYALAMALVFLSLSEALGPILSVISIASVFLYFIIQEAYWNGQTIGKAAFQLRVLNLDGSPIEFKQAVYRNLLRPADFFPVPLLIPLFTMLITSRSQRIGDMVAATLVAKVPRLSLAYSPTPHHYGIHPLEDRIGPLRGLTVEEYVALKRLCDRFPNLPDAVQAQLIESYWRPLAKKLRIKSEAGIHPIFQIEAVVMKFSRLNQLK